MHDLETHALSKSYGTLQAVHELSIRVQTGEIYGFLGLNGSGKTTTIRMLLGMLHPTSGEVNVLGQRVRPGVRGIWSQVGYMVETPRAYGDLTVRENLEVARRLQGVDDRSAVQRIIKRLDLGAYADRRARDLSLGNAQRLGLARALLHEPRLLILDEPANGLDPAGVVQIREILGKHVRDKGGTVFMSSHVLGEVARLATTIGIIHQGRLVEEFRSADLARRCNRWLVVDARDRAAARSTLQSAGFTVTNGDGPLTLGSERAVDYPDDIARLLVGAGVSPTRLSVEQQDLEAHFLDIVAATDRSLACTI